MSFLKVGGKTPLERFLRTIAALLVVGLVGWAFWKNNQNMMERLYEDKPWWDETGTVEPQLRAYAKDFARTMKEGWGVDVRIRIRGSQPERPPRSERMLHLRIAPQKRAVVFTAPAEWPEAKAAELGEYLENTHFERHWDKDWQAGLKSALVLIWNQQRDREASLEQAKGAHAVLLDETGTLTDEERAFVLRFAEGLERDFGQRALVRVFQDEIIVPELDNRTLFLGISPSQRQAVVSFTPIMRRAIGGGLERELTAHHFPAHFDAGDWPAGLQQALIRIWQALAGEELS